jgi:DNA repair protein RadD
MNLRPYQQSAVNAVYEHLRNKDNNPCIVLPTGTGKSVVIAKIVSDAVKNWNGRVLILAHVKELLEQNAGKIKTICPDIELGIFSAGLKSRDTDESVIVAGIQSVYDKACELGSFDLIIVDEAHLIAPDGDGMYRSFLKEMKIINPKVRVIGLTATPFRLKGGLICQPDNILNEVCYEAGLKEMIQKGYLPFEDAQFGEIAKSNGNFTAFDLGFEEVNTVFSFEL